jgi:hypothetical protein
VGFYDEMQDVATELLEEFDQGALYLVRRAKTVTDTARPWDRTIGAPGKTALSGTVRAVQESYIDGRDVVGGERQVTFAYPGFEPAIDDKIEIDGVEVATVKAIRIPDAGTPVAYRYIVRG